MASMDNGGFTSEPANGSGLFGLFDARDFRLTDGRDDTAPATAAARWYFEREVIAVPRPGLPVAGFARRTRPLADVERWARERDGHAPPDHPPLVWVAAPEVVRDARIAEDGRRLETASGSVALDLVPRIPLNRSYFDASSLAFFRERTLRARGTLGSSGFVARTLWPSDFRLGPEAPPERPVAADLPPGDALRARMREMPHGGAEAPFAAETLWQRPGASADWTGLPVLAFLCNGAQGDDDEAHAGHFAIATGRIDAHGDIGDWLVNNYYSLDVESEKGILAAPAPLDNYQGDLNAGQSWYRPTHVLVTVLDDARAAHLVQSALLRLFQQFWRHQLVYDHPRDNCTSMSVDVLRALGPAGAGARADLGRGRVPVPADRRAAPALAGRRAHLVRLRDGRPDAPPAGGRNRGRLRGTMRVHHRHGVAGGTTRAVAPRGRARDLIAAHSPVAVEPGVRRCRRRGPRRVSRTRAARSCAASDRACASPTVPRDAARRRPAAACCRVPRHSPSGPGAPWSWGSSRSRRSCSPERGARGVSRAQARSARRRARKVGRHTSGSAMQVWRREADG